MDFDYFKDVWQGMLPNMEWIVALFAFFIAWNQARTATKQTNYSVQPVLTMVSTSESEPYRFVVQLRNVGHGPAFITEFSHYDGSKQLISTELMDFLGKKILDIKGQAEGRLEISFPDKDYVLAAGGSVDIIKTPVSKSSDCHSQIKAIRNIKFKVTYHSLRGKSYDMDEGTKQFISQ